MIDIETIKRGSWVQINNEQEIKKLKEQYGADFVDFKFTVPGEYFVTTEIRPCPRGCCTDSYLIKLYKEEIVYTILEELKELTEILERLPQ